ncbi:MAG: dethiobiotin synthase, partial [Actinomycetota bacterium]|nr:dethiobiotin synthase [Actinomycetota bacterium]
TGLTFGPAVSPHLAAELAGEPIDTRALVSWVRAASADGRRVVVEGVGGLLVPLSSSFTVRDLAVALRLPVVVAARPGLGTINHALLTLAAARQARLVVAAVVLTPWPARPSTVEQSNRVTIERLGGVEVATLPPLPRAEPDLLRQAGEQLPLHRWFATVETPDR